MSKILIKNFNPAQEQRMQDETHKDNYEEINRTLNKQDVNVGEVVKSSENLVLSTSFQELRGLTQEVVSSGGKHLFLGAISYSSGVAVEGTIQVLSGASVIFELNYGIQNSNHLPIMFVAGLQPGNHKISFQMKTASGGPTINNLNRESYLQITEVII